MATGALDWMRGHRLQAQAVRKQAETALNGAHDPLNELERDLDEARAAGTLPAVPDMRPGRFLVSHVPRIVLERGPSGAATIEHEQRLHSQAALHHAIPRAGGLTSAGPPTLPP